jgi:hypothetical protein
MATINGTSVGGMTLQIDYSYTQNTTANTSTVTAKLQLVSHYALYATALSGSYISVGGSRTDYSTSISYGGSGTTTTVLATKTVTVSHNSNGTGTCNLSGAFVMNGTYRNIYVGTMTVSSTITLPTIPRASGLTVPTSINTGSALSGTVSPSSTSFNHKVELKIGSTVKQTITLATGTNTFSVTIPHSWIPNSTSATISVVLSAYSGTTFIASTTKNVTANVPASVVPSVSAFTAVSSVTTGTFANLYVQGKTTAKLTATATAGDGSSIASYTYSGSGISTTVTTNTATTSTLQATGTQTYTVTVKDARGRTANKTVSITVYPYATPSIGPVSVQRCDSSGNLTESGTYAKYTVNSAYSTVNSKNTRTVTIAYSSNNGSSYSAETTLQATTDTASTKTGVYGGGAFAISSAYILRFTIKDAYGATKTITAPLQSAARPINIRSNGKGVSIGAMSTKDAFEVSMDADFNKNVNIDGTLTTVGKINGVDIGTDTYVVGGARDDIADENWISSAPSFIGTYSQNDQWYSTISCRHRNGQGDGTNYGLQLRSILTKADNLSWRQNMNGSWGGWKTILDSNNTADYVVEQGTSGIWTYRKWNSGLAECWGIYTMTSACTKAWGALYYSDTLAPRINYPFTFTSRPQESVFCRGDSVSAWAYPEGGGIGMNTTTQTGQYGFLRPTTMTAAQVRYEYTVVGRWK